MGRITSQRRVGGLAMSLGPESSLADTPESLRYRRILEGDSLAAARLSQGAAVGKEAAGKIFGKVKATAAKTRQAAKDRRAIESGDVKDIS